MIGTKLSHYKIISKLGQGGMGEVYLAEDSRLDRKVALKILPERLSDRAELRERFEREARAVSSLMRYSPWVEKRPRLPMSCSRTVISRPPVGVVRATGSISWASSRP